MSNGPFPTITFQVNLETLNRQGHLVPNRTETSGNETVSEANNQKVARSTLIPGVILDNRVLRHGDTFSESGNKAVYLKNTYATGEVDALLRVVSIT